MSSAITLAACSHSDVVKPLETGLNLCLSAVVYIEKKGGGKLTCALIRISQVSESLRFP